MNPKLKKILQQLEQSRLITLKGDKYELSHDTLAGAVSSKRTVDEKALIEIELLVRNKYKASFNEATKDYLTEKQLIYIEPFEHQLELGQNEILFIQESKTNAQELSIKREKERKLALIGLFTVLFLLLMTFWALYTTGKAQRNLVEEKHFAQAKADTALSYSYAALAQKELLINEQPIIAAWIAYEACKKAQTPEAMQILFSIIAKGADYQQNTPSNPTNTTDTINTTTPINGVELYKSLDVNHPIQQVVVSNNGDYTLTIDSKNILQVWDKQWNMLHQLIQSDAKFKSAAFSPDGAYICALSQEKRTLWQWDVKKGKLLWEKELKEAPKNMSNDIMFPSWSFNFSPNGDYVVIAAKWKVFILDNGGNTIHQWEVNHPGPDGLEEKLRGSIEFISFLKDSKSILLYSSNYMLHIVNHLVPKESEQTGQVATYDLDGAKIKDLSNFIQIESIFSRIHLSNLKNYYTKTDFDNKQAYIRRLNDHKTVLSTEASSLVISPNEQFVIASFKTKTKVLELNTGATILTTKKPQQPGNYNFTPDNKYIYFISSNNKAKIFDLKGNFIAQFNNIRNITFIPYNNSEFIVTDTDGKVKLFRLAQPVLIQELVHKKEHAILSKSKAQYLSQSSKDSFLHVMSFNGDTLSSISTKFAPFGTILSDDGKYISKFETEENSSICIWDKKGTLVYKNKLFDTQTIFSKIGAIAFSPQDGILLYNDNDKQLATILNFKTKEKLHSFSYKKRNSNNGLYLFSPKGTFVYTLSQGDTIRLRNALDASITEIRLTHYSKKTSPFALSQSCFSNDDAYLLARSSTKDSIIQVFKTDGNKLGLMKHDKPVIDITIFPNKNVAITQTETTTRVWSIAPIKLLASTSKLSTKRSYLCPNDSIILVQGQEMYLWNWMEDSYIKTSHPSVNIERIAFSPDSAYVVTYRHPMLRLCDFQGNLLIESEIGKKIPYALDHLRFSPDGSRIILFTMGETFYYPTPQTIIKEMDKLKSPLSPAQRKQYRLPQSL